MAERKVRKTESNKKEIKFAKTVAKIERIQDGNSASTKVGIVNIEDVKYYFSATMSRMPVVFGHKDPVYASKELAKALNNEMLKRTEGKKLFVSLERIDKQIKYVEEYMLIIKQGKKYFGYMQGKADSRAVVYAEGSKPYSCAAKTLIKDLDRPGKKSFRSMAGQGKDIRKMIDKLMEAIEKMNKGDNNPDPDDPTPNKDKLLRKKEEPKDKVKETAAAEEPAIRELKNGNGKSIKRQKRVKRENKPKEKKTRERRSAKTNKETKVIETKAEEIVETIEVVEEPENGSPMKLGKDFKEGERTEYYCFECNEPTTLYRRGCEFVCDNCGEATEIIEDEEYPISEKPVEKPVEEAEESKEPEIPEDNINDKIEKLKQDIELNRKKVIDIMNMAFEVCQYDTDLDSKLCELTGEQASVWIENIRDCSPSDEEFITNFEDEVDLLLEEECYYELISAIVKRL